MLRRFASACAIPVIGIPIVLLVIVLSHSLTVPKAYPLTTIWCFAPVIWGIWAMLAPSSWVPNRLPIWGTILGLGIGSFAIFALNLPHVLFRVNLSPTWSVVCVAGMVVLYFFLWMLVRAVYRSLNRAGN